MGSVTKLLVLRLLTGFISAWRGPENHDSGAAHFGRWKSGPTVQPDSVDPARAHSARAPVVLIQWRLPGRAGRNFDGISVHPTPCAPRGPSVRPVGTADPIARPGPRSVRARGRVELIAEICACTTALIGARGADCVRCVGPAYRPRAQASLARQTEIERQYGKSDSGNPNR